MSNFAEVPGIGVISCKKAVEFRDDELLKKYDALVRGYDAGREKRIQLQQEKLGESLAIIKSKWMQTEGILQKQVVANAIGVALSGGGWATGRWIASKGSLSSVERIVAKELMDRGSTFTNNAISAGLTNSVDVASLVLLPAATIVSVVAFPAVSAVVTAVGFGIGVVGLGESLADYFIEKNVYSSSYAQFEQGLIKLGSMSVVNQLHDINEVKNAIDSRCG